MKAGRLESTVLSLTTRLLFRMCGLVMCLHLFGISQLLGRSPVLSRVCKKLADFACLCVSDRPMSRAKFLWLRAIAAIGLQWRKVCIYGPVECRLEPRSSSSGVGSTPKLMLGPSETSGSRRKAVEQFSETAECQHE